MLTNPVQPSYQLKNKRVLTASLILLCLALAAVIIPAFYARFMADDYCMNAGAQNAGFTSFFNSVYTNWSGRFAYIASTFYISRIPPQFFGLLVTIVLLLWVFVLSRTFKEGGQLLNFKIGWIESQVLSVVFLIILFKTAPNLYQDLYWRDGFVNYILPIFFTSLSLLLVLNILQTRFTVPKALFLGISTLLSAGFSESASIANLTFWTSLVIICLFLKNPRRKGICVVLVFAAFAALFGFLIELLAPGNQVRAGILPDRPGIWQLAGLTLRNVAHLYGRLFIYGFPWVLVCTFIGMYLGFNARRRSSLIASPQLPSPMRSWFIAAALVNFLIGSGVCAAVAYLMKAYPDDRIVIVPYFFAILTILMTGVLIGARLPVDASSGKNSRNFQRLISGTPYFLLVLVVVLSFTLVTSLIKSLPALVDYAQRWDARDALIRAELAAGKRDLMIPGLESRYGLPDLQLEKEDWVNTCTAGYYGASSITGK
ncbi:MAG TPA: DUF6056 family protein [Anaerolineaceae bacterium]|nr:DUF6056 family protein [Anaerolineaceae bacterium]